MKMNSVAAMAVAVLCGCVWITPPLYAADWVPAREYSIEYPLNLSGTLIKGVSNATEPKPLKSEYFQVQVGGVSLWEDGAHLLLKVKCVNPLPEGAVIEIEFPNPQQPDKPFLIEETARPQEQEYVFISSEPVWGLKGYRSYAIKISVYQKSGDHDPIDHLAQNVRTYVDTQDPRKVLVFRKLLSAAGIAKRK